MEREGVDVPPPHRAQDKRGVASAGPHRLATRCTPSPSGRHASAAQRGGPSRLATRKEEGCSSVSRMRTMSPSDPQEERVAILWQRWMVWVRPKEACTPVTVVETRESMSVACPIPGPCVISKGGAFLTRV